MTDQSPSPYSGLSAHEAGYRAFQQAGRTARNPFPPTDDRSFQWATGYAKARAALSGRAET